MTARPPQQPGPSKASEKPGKARLPYRPCVGIMILNAGGHVWLGKRHGSPDDAEGQGHWWQMPQGGIDEGEDAWLAALREAGEETGMRSLSIIAEHPEWLTYDLPRHLYGRAWGGRYGGQKQRWFLARFNGPESEIDISKGVDGHPPEFEAWRWAKADELVELIVPFKRDVYAKVVAAFGHLATPI